MIIEDKFINSLQPPFEMELSRKEILEAHLGGKLSVELLRKLKTVWDLKIAYTPGVAEVCREIQEHPESYREYTTIGNTVAVMTDGSAVLGLGNIGAKASVPVMEGKAVLFKKFGEVNAWPVPLEYVRDDITGRTDVDKFVAAVAAVGSLYGGINLEDIAAPECFEVEERLDSMLGIPVFHDDQWGTASVVSAASMSSQELTGRTLKNSKVTILGAGAGGLRTAVMLKEYGAQEVTLVDRGGVIYTGRNDLEEPRNRYKREHAVPTKARTLEDAMRGTDFFIGLSAHNLVTSEMIKSMNSYPIIFAMANPTPEIMPELVQEAMGDKPYIMATGRSDYKNQVNNVLVFPYIFRAALEVKAPKITMAMKKAAVEALAQLTREGNVPEEALRAHGREKIEFGPNYIIPLLFDPRLQDRVTSAVKSAYLLEQMKLQGLAR